MTKRPESPQRKRGYGHAEILVDGQWQRAETKFSNGWHMVEFNGEFWPVSHAHSDHAKIVLSPGVTHDVRMHDWSDVV